MVSQIITFYHKLALAFSAKNINNQLVVKKRRREKNIEQIRGIEQTDYKDLDTWLRYLQFNGKSFPNFLKPSQKLIFLQTPCKLPDCFFDIVVRLVKGKY